MRGWWPLYYIQMEWQHKNIYKRIFYSYVSLHNYKPTTHTVQTVESNPTQCNKETLCVFYTKPNSLYIKNVNVKQACKD